MKIKKNTNEPIINADETGFQILPTSIQTWAYKNTKNVVVNVVESDKDRISIMSSITSNYEKLPLFIIGKGNDEETVEENLGPMLNNNTFTFSNKSYMDTKCFCEYLQFLRSLYTEDQTIHLIVDSYSSHTSKLSKQTAQSLNIQLYFIPSGFTDTLQPCDIAIFAPLKSMANAKLRRLLFGNENSPIGMEKAVQFLQESWEEISVTNLIKAWEQYC